MALLGALVDSFRAAVLNTALWNAVNAAGNSGQQAGGQYTFIVQAGATGDASLDSDIAYDLTGSHLHIELISAGVQESGLEMYPIILTQNPANITNSLLIVVAGGFLGCYQFVAGVGTALATPAYSPTAHRWLRVRQAAGTVHFEASPDHRAWTVLASVVPTIAITALYMRARTFCYLALATAKMTAISNVNFVAPPDVEFPNGAIPVGLELAFGADLSADPATWDWTDVTPEGSSDFMSQDVSVSRGRADESSQVAPTSAEMDLDNPAGDYTPDNPLGAYYPNVDLGTPARWWLNAGSTRLYLSPTLGARAEVASISSLNITTDLDVRVDLHLKTMDAGGSPPIVAGRANPLSTFSWELFAWPNSTVSLFWSPDGSTILSATSTMPVLPSSARATVRATLDVNNGAGGWTATFYLSDSVTGTFTQIGTAVTGVGVTSIFNATQPLTVGSDPRGVEQQAADATVYRFQLRNGIGGTVIADADFTAQVSGLNAFVDSTGLAWTIYAPAELSDRWFRIVGTVDEWTPTWPWGDLSAQQDGGLGGGEARVGLAIAGILRRLGQGASALESPVKRSIVFQPTLRAYWPMEDGKDSTQIASGIEGGAPATFTGVIDFASDDTLAGSKPLPTLDDSTGISGAVSGTFSGLWQVDWYVNIPSPGPVGATTIMTVSTSTGTVVLWKITITGAAVTVTGQNAVGGTATTATGAPVGFFAGWVHLRLYAEQNAGNVDWTLIWFPVEYPLPVGSFLTNTYAGVVGGVTGWGVPPGAELGGISMGHVAVLDVAAAGSWDNAATGWLGEAAAVRIARLCAEQGISIRLIGDGETTEQMGVQQIATLLTLLNDAESADGGVLYERQDAVGLVYRTRESMYNQPANLTLDALQGQLQNPFSPVLDDQRLRNDVTVTRQSGSSLEVLDAASIAKRGTYDEAVTLNLYSDTQLPGAAGWLLHQGTAPGMRYPQVSTNLGVAPEVIDGWLTVDQGARMDVVNLPPQHSTEPVRVIAEGYVEPVSPVTWAPIVNCSPGAVWDVGVIDGTGVDAAYLLRLETDGSELALTIDADDTALAVAVTAGPDWTADNAETPFDIRIGGERLTVTDIAARAGAAATTAAATAYTGANTVSFVAPSVVAPAVGDLLICSWLSFLSTGTYTLPGGMTIGSRTDAAFTSLEQATKTLGASGATGTQTATFSTPDKWTATSVVVHAGSGSPVVVEVVSGVAISLPLTLATSGAPLVGDWLLLINGWDWDPAGAMGAPDSTWMAVTDSVTATITTSRTRVWAKRVAKSGVQSVLIPLASSANDNHGRLYVLRGLTGPTQAFTVVRNINGAARAHDAGSAVTLWFQPVLAR